MSSVTYLIDKLYNIDQALGGSAKTQEKAKSADEFNVLKELILANLYDVKKKSQSKENQQRNVNMIKIEHEIKEKLGEADKILTKMNEVLRKQQKDKKYPPKDIEKKQKLYENLRTQIQQVRAIVFDNVVDEQSSIETLADHQKQLFGGINGNSRQKPVEMSQDDKDAIQRWKEEDQKQDEMLKGINTGLGTWQVQIKRMGEAIDTTMSQIDKLDTEVDKTSSTLDTTNKKLKDIIQKYRAPSKFCIDVILILTLVGLVVMGYYQFKK